MKKFSSDTADPLLRTRKISRSTQFKIRLSNHKRKERDEQIAGRRICFSLNKLYFRLIVNNRQGEIPGFLFQILQSEPSEPDRQ